MFVQGVAWAETVTIWSDQKIPQFVFAAGDIKTALEGKKHQAQLKELSSLADQPAESAIIIALATQQDVLARLAKHGGNKIPDVLGEQGYALRTTQMGDKKIYWVIGGDINGAMYGALQMAENIQFSDVKESYNVEEKPFLKNRGIKFNIPLDKSSPTYFHGFDGTSHKMAVKDVWDMTFWTTWFDEMARHRYNVLSLWSPHPFTSMVNMEDEYPGIAINGVTGFDENGKETKINSLTIDEKIAFWRSVMRYGKERGFDLYFCNWNVFLSTAKNKHGLTDSSENPKTKEYLHKCLKKFLSTYPDLKGFGVTIGEKMGDLDHLQRAQWAWDTYGKAMLDYAQDNPARDLVFIHRQHEGDIDHILAHFASLDKLPNVRFELSCKYSEAHAHTTVTPSRWHKTKMEKGLDKYGITSWLTVRNDDFFFLHWAEPEFVRQYIKGFPTVDKYVRAFYIGADGWVFAREFTSTNKFFEDKNALSIQRTWLMQKLWGRISYNPAITDDYFIRHLAARFPTIDSTQLFTAWSSASGAIRRANEQVTGEWYLDQDFWPEMWTGDNWKKNGRHFSVEETKAATPFNGSKLCSFADTAKNKCGDKISAFDNIEQIDQLSLQALAILKNLNPGSDVELQLTLKDLTAQAHLGRYNALKFRTVMCDLQGKKDQAKELMGKAYWSWRAYTDMMAELYKPVAMQRNKSFSSWHDYDDVVLKEYHKLGGEGMPERTAE
jgi:Glycosyl hydrolase family 67 N-terminus